MSVSALWRFAHHVLAHHFGQDPARFIAALEGDSAISFLEQSWQWAVAGQAGAPAQPPLRYSIERPRSGLVVVRMSFSHVTSTGEPWHARFIARDPDPGKDNGYYRAFMLEHDQYASEQAGAPRAIVCESLADGGHRNWGEVLPPDDVANFDRAVIETIQKSMPPAAESLPRR